MLKRPRCDLIKTIKKVQKSKAKDISKSSEVVMNRNKIKNIIQTIISNYINIIDEKEKLTPIENKINEYIKIKLVILNIRYLIKGLLLTKFIYLIKNIS